MEEFSCHFVKQSVLIFYRTREGSFLKNLLKRLTVKGLLLLFSF